MRRVGGGHNENPFQQARARAGLTQDQAAEQIGCELRSQRRYEAGKRLSRADMIQRMMRAFDCEFAILLPAEFLKEGEETNL